MDAMIVVDMQTGLFAGAPKHDLDGVISRIDQLAAMTRARSGTIIWIQHCGRPNEELAPGKPGWSLLPALKRAPGDVVVRKTLNDAFCGTNLARILDNIKPKRVLIAGWATDFCVDATVRSAVSHNYDVVVVADAHTLSDRPHLDAASVIRHQNWVWGNLITDRSVKVANAAALLSEAAATA